VELTEWKGKAVMMAMLTRKNVMMWNNTEDGWSELDHVDWDAAPVKWNRRDEVMYNEWTDLWFRRWASVYRATADEFAGRRLCCVVPLTWYARDWIGCVHQFVNQLSYSMILVMAQNLWSSTTAYESPIFISNLYCNKKAVL